VIGTAILTVAVLTAPLNGASPARSTETDSRFQQALRGDESVVVRGQSAVFTGPVLGTPESVTSYYQTPTYAPNGTTPAVTDPTFGNSVAPGNVMPSTSDPFLNGGVDPYGAAPYGGYQPYGATPYPGTAPGIYSFGLNGPQPYDVGWLERFNVGFIATEGTDLGSKFGVFEFDYSKEHAMPLGGGWVALAEPQYNLRLYEGPAIPAVAVGGAYPVPGGIALGSPEMPGDVHRFGLGLKVRTPNVAGWIFEGGFNPAIGTDFEQSLTSDAWMFDGHVVGFLQFNERWMGAIGAAYWDRVDDVVLPYAGIVWTPNEYLEARLLFPKPRVSLFLGTPFGIPTWAYVEGEYRIEAYQVDIKGPGAVDLNADGIVDANELVNLGPSRVQLEDWRVVGGLQMEGAFMTGFVEAGAAIGREVKYDTAVRSFKPDSAFIFRMGIRF
jgi:hypothetical protein